MLSMANLSAAVSGTGGSVVVVVVASPSGFGPVMSAVLVVVAAPGAVVVVVSSGGIGATSLGFPVSAGAAGARVVVVSTTGIAEIAAGNSSCDIARIDGDPPAVWLPIRQQAFDPERAPGIRDLEAAGGEIADDLYFGGTEGELDGVGGR